jgi:hypothetical protein
MKRELFIHFSFWFSFFVVVTLFNKLFSLSYWPFWLGGLIGLVLPDLDHFLYAYFIHPQDLSSQRVNHLLQNSQVKRSVELLYETRNERRGLIFHTVLFQAIFFILTFWMLSSSGSMLGKGLVLSFALHLAVDQLIDLTETQSMENWFKNLPFNMDYAQSKNFWIATTTITILLGILV